MTTKVDSTPAIDPSALITRIESLGQLYRFRVQDRDVVWRRFGKGRPLVLLHGGHGSWLHWIRNIEPLMAHHELWVADLPGFGDSDSLSGDPHAADRLEHLVSAVCACVERIGIQGDPIQLAGFSFGGLVAANVAARCGNVSKLALLGPAGHGGPRRQTIAMKDWRSDNPEEATQALRHNLAALMLYDHHSIDPTAMLVHERACRATRFRSKALSRQGSLAESLSRFHRPTLFVWGEHDVTAIPLDAASQLSADAPYRDWCLIPGAGHWVQYERPQEVNQLLLRWFSSIE
ncbi:alpha/beta fold hydrolase [Cupriavidus sp. L7L]|uniref:alpha/beta fold hydrolase n=1 Tax=Cupriavidus sp. L7L TaxID=2546443 RepID=UPI001055E2D1|nr:alpha/beta fold hydrolase [Cupriavidus sp. L7L]TDF62147.1 alpha/beta fold hydrolase [Cupriavidus sp. L7L]